MSAQDPREPDEVLALLGARLAAAGVSRPKRRRVARAALLAGVLCALLVPAAVAMLPDSASDPTRPAGARTPDRVSPAVTLARGANWTLSAQRCEFGAAQTVALTLQVPGGLAGRRCTALAPGQLTGPALPPLQYVDSTRDRTLVFGAVPAGTARVRLILDGGRPRVITARRAQGIVFYIASLDPGERLLGALGEAADGTPTIRCDGERCA